MPRAWILLPLTLAATPLAAQLTPAERAAREQAPSAARSTALSDSWERRSLDGDPTAYFGAAASQERRDRDLRYRTWRLPYLTAPARLESGAVLWGYRASTSDLADHWFAIGQRAGTPRQLRRAPVGQVDARAEVPLALTLASPIGAPGHALMIRTAVGGARSPDVWSRMGEVVPDEHGNYRVEIPALHAGTYDLQIAVYDPEVPEIPYSASQSTLIVWTP